MLLSFPPRPGAAGQFGLKRIVDRERNHHNEFGGEKSERLGAVGLLPGLFSVSCLATDTYTFTTWQGLRYKLGGRTLISLMGCTSEIPISILKGT